jgi:hypothetical protein
MSAWHQGASSALPGLHYLDWITDGSRFDPGYTSLHWSKGVQTMLQVCSTCEATTNSLLTWKQLLSDGNFYAAD